MDHTQIIILRLPSRHPNIIEPSELRQECFEGEIFTLYCTTLNHNAIVGNLRTLFKAEPMSKGCRIFTENVKFIASPNYAYPDVIVLAADNDRRQSNSVEAPSIIVEVQSKITEDADRGFKMKMYTSNTALQNFMFVSQYEYYVELYTRTNQKNVWTYQTFDQPTDIIKFESLNFEITLSAIYENIVFIPDEEII